jgi:hypothetical protein
MISGTASRRYRLVHAKSGLITISGNLSGVFTYGKKDFPDAPHQNSDLGD